MNKLRAISPLVMLLLLFLASLTARAQIEQAVQLSHEVLPSGGAAVGEVVTVSIHARIDPGFHTYSAQRVPDMEMLAATFDLDETAKDVELVGKLTDQGERETAFDDIFGAEVSLFHHEVTYRQKIKVTGPNPQLTGYLRYQVCDDSRCVPGTYDLDQALKVKAKAPAPAPEKQPAAAPKPEKEPAQEPLATINEPVMVPTLPAPGAEPESDSDITRAVKWQPQLLPEGKPQVGDVMVLTFEAKIDPGFHIYSAVPPAKPAGLPTTFELDESAAGVSLVGGLQESGEKTRSYDEIFETEVEYFKDRVVFKQQVRIDAVPAMLEGYLAYQVCDDSRCVNDKLDVSYAWGDIQSAAVTEVAEPQKPETAIERDGLGMLFLKGFLFGLASLFTPCIFPMIPLTVSFFTKQNKNRAHGIRNALLYGGSIVAIYTVLGLLVSIILGGDAMRQLAVNPWANLFFFAVIFIFALSFLGMFEITLPSSWSTNVGKNSDRGGVLGIFLMALTLVIVSFSCTGPLVSTAMFEAATGESYLGPTITMLAFSSAIALPFALFAVFPGWLNSLPQSGGWLNSVKVTLGFLELALAMIYLSRADLVMHWGLLDRDVMIGAWIVIFGLLGVYLLGKLQLPHDDKPERISVPRLLLAMASLWFVLYLVPGLWGAPLKMLGGYLPSDRTDMGVMLSDEQQFSAAPAPGDAGALSLSNADICNYPGKISGHLSKDSPKGFCAFYDLEQGLAYAKDVGKPVFLDFTGHTCANCRYLEKNAWPDPELRRYLTEEYVLISLYTDDSEKLAEVEYGANGKKLRTVGDKWIQYQIDTYRSNAQPFYVLLDHDQSMLQAPMGFDPPLDVQEYRDYFAAGLAEFQQRHGMMAGE